MRPSSKAYLVGGGIGSLAAAAFLIRAAQMAVYQSMGIDKQVSPVTPRGKSIQARFEALLKALE